MAVVILVKHILSACMLQENFACMVIQKKNKCKSIFSRFLTLLHSELPKLHRVLAVLSGIGLKCSKLQMNGLVNFHLQVRSANCLNLSRNYFQNLGVKSHRKIYSFLSVISQ